MRINGKHYRTIWLEESGGHAALKIIDQSKLPFEVVTEAVKSSEQAIDAIKEMRVRGAPLIGVTGAYAVWLLAKEIDQRFKKNESESQQYFKEGLNKIAEARPTAVNLSWAVNEVASHYKPERNWADLVEIFKLEAVKIADQDVELSRSIGEHGLKIIEDIAARKKGTLNILTHCNAGWLATVDYGTATAPIYLAHAKGIKLHVWVDETRPRLQGSKLTAFELGQEGIAHTVISDNTGGHLMQHGMVDLCIVGSDRTTRCADVGNKIGTYLKALAAKDNGVPFYAALPSSTIDWSIRDGIKEVPIEKRSIDEVTYVDGWSEEYNAAARVRIAPSGSAAVNYGFDITPARLLAGIITERGVAEASEAGLLELYPEYKL